MRLYLVRHAQACPKSQDKTRPLTPTGARDAQAIGQCLCLLDVEATAIWHSRKARSRQTAEIIAASLRARRCLKPRPDINPRSPARPVARKIGKERGDLMIVGHQPFLSRLASELLCLDGSRDIVDLSKSSVLCLDHSGDSDWHMEWMLSLDMAYLVTQSSRSR